MSTLPAAGAYGTQAPIAEKDTKGARGRGGIKRDILAALLEFVGTTLFLILGLGGIQASISSSAADDVPSGAPVTSLTFSCLSMGLALLVTVWLFYRNTGGIFNPNVTLGLLLVRAISPVRFILYIIAQFAGAIAASAILQALLPGRLRVNTVPAAGTSKTQAVFIEMFATAALVWAALALTAKHHGNGWGRRGGNNNNSSDAGYATGATGGANYPGGHDQANTAYRGGANHQDAAFAAIGIGLTFFVGQLFALQFTGASLNTARSFGPAVITDFNKSHWVYWVGPFAGTLLATAFYYLFKWLKYDRLNADHYANDNGYGYDQRDAYAAPHHGHGKPRMSASTEPTVV